MIIVSVKEITNEAGNKDFNNLIVVKDWTLKNKSFLEKNSEIVKILESEELKSIILLDNMSDSEWL